jgi:hypothetical protein
VSAWYSIEVFDGATPASIWAEAYRDSLMETALTHGATDWSWHRHTWGVVFEVSFDNETAWESFTNLPSVRAALDAVPDPVTGLIVYRGRGGSSGAPFPRRPRPLIGSGSAALPLPWDLGVDELPALTSLGLPRPTLAGVGARARAL